MEFTLQYPGKTTVPVFESIHSVSYRHTRFVGGRHASGVQLRPDAITATQTCACTKTLSWRWISVKLCVFALLKEN